VTPRQPVPEVAQQLLRWTFGGFAILMLSGLTLVYTEPVKTHHSFWAPIKLGLLILAGLNARIFQAGVYKKCGGVGHRRSTAFWGEAGGGSLACALGRHRDGRPGA
jgi:hypothetical protein